MKHKNNKKSAMPIKEEPVVKSEPPPPPAMETAAAPTSTRVWPIFYKVRSAAACGCNVFNYSEVVFLMDRGYFARLKGPGDFTRIPEEVADIIVERAYIGGQYDDPDSLAGRVARGVEKNDNIEVDDEGRVFVKASYVFERAE